MIERLRSDDKSPLLSIASEWRVLFRPEKTGCYVNDHSIIRSADGKWHLFGITSHDPNPEQERYFAHGSGPLLWSDTPMEEHNPVCNDGVRAWAPAVIASEHQYYMLYGPSPTKLAISRDLSHWIGTVPSLVGAPPEACHRDHMILPLEPSTWLLYASGIDAHGLGMISLFVSNDLINWRFIRAALRTEGRRALRCAWGAAESPFVFSHNGWYYLSVTYTDCSEENYSDTLLFRSSNPFDFGTYNADRPDDSSFQRIKAHAPEYLCNGDDWYITACGWPGFTIPHKGAVSIARLEWKET